MILTKHAKQRMQERDITRTDIQYALVCGRPERSTEYRVYRIDRRMAHRQNPALHHRLCGLTVVCTHGEIVVTAYRNVT